MLQKYYECIGRRDTLSGEVLRQVRYLARKGSGPGAGRMRYYTSTPIYACACELESWELDISH